ncbi:hypothetical protein SNOG_16259 [Parastagonospora nodorum SN15]|uniref:SET domain-containing protein n=1 Tax=Phaeosphaeria nodorum (strain SN15 / ATCC MYA-4574 / FGSC 10173) TaxID=321614 RepID=Q0TWE1_PHANO|nr:hypothetical protein SNOG_16259 [Parastagonospora nodorum SN15]EAT76443.2 hypothetical protein SNOG_16259 [Parastagonospora nodorum SN15]
MAIQRAKPKKTRKGQSSITGGGIGLFTAEVFHQDDFIGEYRGEKITKKEGERRALDAQNNNRANYIFALNDCTPGTDEDVDAGRGGNHTKWINNADIDQTNCYAANLVIDGKNRVGIFAADRVEKGQELFFHYYWPKEFTQAFGTPPDFQAPRAPCTLRTSKSPEISTPQASRVKNKNKGDQGRQVDLCKCEDTSLFQSYTTLDRVELHNASPLDVASFLVKPVRSCFAPRSESHGPRGTCAHMYWTW